MRWEDRQHRKNREAEEAHARKVAWGVDQDMADDEMGDNIQIGDTQNHYHNEGGKGSGLSKTILAAGIAAAGLGFAATVPIIAWNLTRPSEGQSDTNTDTDTKYGLQFLKEDQ